MAVIIRPIRDEDYAAVAQAGNAAFPGVPHTAQGIRDDDRCTPPQLFARWVAEVDGQVVGTACYFQSQARYHPQKFWMDAYVHPDYQGQGLGAALYEQVLAAVLPHGPVSLRTFTREDLPRGIRFFEERGFAEGKRTWVSSLDLERFDRSPFGDVAGQVAAQGIAICPLTDLQGDPGWEQRLVDLYNAIQVDIPDIDPASAVSLEHFRRRQLENPHFRPEGHLIALDGEQWIGMSTLWTSDDAQRLEMGVTGVLPEHRGRGIAAALKLRGIDLAREKGYRRIRTMNASTNRPILAINERLGFVREPAWIHLIRRF